MASDSVAIKGFTTSMRMVSCAFSSAKPSNKAERVNKLYLLIAFMICRLKFLNFLLSYRFLVCFLLLVFCSNNGFQFLSSNVLNVFSFVIFNQTLQRCL